MGLFSGTTRQSRKTRFRILVLISVAAATAASGYAHYMWTQDQYLGFIDDIQGTLSPAGWWHLGFTTIEMSFVFVFILAWIDALRDSGYQGSDSANLAWKGFLCYALISIADFLVFHWYVLPLRTTQDHTAFTSWQGLLVIVFSVALDAYIRFLKRTRAFRAKNVRS